MFHLICAAANHRAEHRGRSGALVRSGVKKTNTTIESVLVTALAVCVVACVCCGHGGREMFAVDAELRPGQSRCVWTLQSV